MEPFQQHERSELFLVRLSVRRDPFEDHSDISLNETNCTTRPECYGTVQHTASGKTRTFRGWDGLNAALSEMLHTLINRTRR
jgi:hypothetical protein